MAPAASDPIVLYNRRTRSLETERVPGQKLLSFCYQDPLGRWLCRWLVSRPVFSRVYGWPFYQSRSRRQIDAFIRHNQIDMSEVQVPPGGFRSFNDFFIRQLKPGARTVAQDPADLVAPADSRLKVLSLERETVLQVKGVSLTLAQILGTKTVPRVFDGGLCLQFRLAPCDYHRFGYIEGGFQGPVHSVGGRLYSVNPIALRQMPAIWGGNYRHWCFIQTEHLGTLLQIEVGATVVGSIVQHVPGGGPCSRGREKGYFQMGGSTVLVVLPPGSAEIDTDILHYSRQGIETLVRYGERIGRIRGI